MDRELFARLARKVEVLADVAGWDRPPSLYVVYDRAVTATADLFGRIMRPQGQPIALGGYAAQPILGERMFYTAYMDRCLEAWDVVTRFSESLAFGDDDQTASMADGLRLPGVAGFVFRGEGWHNRGREMVARAVFGELHFSDVPTSVEVRLVYGHDVDGGRYRIIRPRGGVPEVDVSAGDGGWRGDFSTALALLVDVVNGTVPSSAEYRTRYPTLRETLGGSR